MANKRTEVTIPIEQRHSVTVPTAAEFCGLSESYIWEQIAAGKLHTSKIGRRRLIIVSSLIAMISPAKENLAA